MNILGKIFKDIAIKVDCDEENSGNIDVCFSTDKDTTRRRKSGNNEHIKYLPLDNIGTGLLQTIQIIAYIVYFKPKLLLLDEPDSHLHPDNVRKLVNTLEEIVSTYDLQVILSTHSRTLISTLQNKATFFCISNGNIEKNKSVDFYDTMVELGAFDSFDMLGSGCTHVFLSEDSNMDLLKIIAQSSGLALKKIEFLPYDSSSRLDYAIRLADFIADTYSGIIIIIHRDRDFMTDQEVTSLLTLSNSKVIHKDNIRFWITDNSDIEGYYVTSAHLQRVLSNSGLDEVAASAVITKIATTYRSELLDSFRNKREEIKKSNLYEVQGDKRMLKYSLSMECPDSSTLIVQNTLSEPQRLGKFMYGQLNNWFQTIHSINNHPLNYISPTLAIASLQKLL